MQISEDKKRFIKKMCILGDPSVGKTSLVLKYVKQSFSPEYLSTIGAVAYKKEIEIKNASVYLVIWDIAGQETFDAVRLAYFKGAEGAFVVCDSLRENTYNHIEDWISSLYRVQKGVPIIFLANKIDLLEEDKSNYIKEKMRLISENYKTEYFLTSAKEGTNVENAFLLLAKKMVKV